MLDFGGASFSQPLTPQNVQKVALGQLLSGIGWNPSCVGEGSHTWTQPPFFDQKTKLFRESTGIPSLKRSSRRVFAPENGPGTGRCIHFLLGQNAHFQGVNSLSFRECKLNKNIAWTINISEKKYLNLINHHYLERKRGERNIVAWGTPLSSLNAYSTFFD